MGRLAAVLALVVLLGLPGCSASMRKSHCESLEPRWRTPCEIIKRDKARPDWGGSAARAERRYFREAHSDHVKRNKRWDKRKRK